LIDSFKLDELEFVIQDNSDNNQEILDYLKGFSNSNIKYYYRNDALTMSGNADVAIKNATGKYICYIGDDDGVCRNVVDVVRWMDDNNIEASYNSSAWYFWSGGRVKIFKNNKRYSIFNSKSALIQLLQKGLVLDNVEMPLIYHGIVLKSKLMELQNKIGTCFPGNPPDIAGSIALSSIIDRFYKLNTPVVINGISAMAGGGVLKEGGVLSLEQVPFINKTDIDNWEKIVPPIWCGHYAWTNSGIKAFRKLGLGSELSHLNIYYSLAGAVALRPKVKSLRKASYKYALNKVYLTFLITILWVKKYITKVSNNLWFKVYQEYNLRNIVEAENKIYNYVKNKKILKKNKWFRSIYSFYLEKKYKSLYEKDPHLAANEEYRAIFHKDINWENPNNLMEKINWLQFNTDTSLWTLCADKYRVREYIEKKGLGQCLPKLYGHWDKAEDIDFDTLPNSFVMKVNNGCGTVLVVKDKSKLNQKKTKKMLAKWLNKPFGYMGAQMHYLRIKPCIIAEELLINDYKSISPNSMVDFKVWCINGIPESILIVYDRSKGHYCLDLYDINWNRMKENFNFNNHFEFRENVNIPKPACLDEILEISKNLSKPFDEVRIDFYVMNEKPIIGELTFTTGFGYFSKEYYKYLGSKIDINKYTKE
jgi:Glycosyl transferase family 2.